MDAETQSDVMFRAATWLHTNRKQVVTAAVIIVIVALAAGLYAWKKTSDDSSADAQLMDLPSVPGVNTDMGPATATPYLNIARQYPSTPAGVDAQLLGAETLFLEGKYPEAEQEFNQFLNDHPESDLLADAMMGVAASLEAEGKTPEAMRKYQEIIAAYPTDAGIVEPAKLTLARMSEAANKADQAFQYYVELARTQNPADPWAAEARERAVLLLAHHPELRKTEAPAPSANPFATSAPGSYAPGPPLRQPTGGPAAPMRQSAPAPTGATAPARQANPGVNFLSIPNNASNGAAHP